MDGSWKLFFTCTIITNSSSISFVVTLSNVIFCVPIPTVFCTLCDARFQIEYRRFFPSILDLMCLFVIHVPVKVHAACDYYSKYGWGKRKEGLGRWKWPGSVGFQLRNNYTVSFDRFDQTRASSMSEQRLTKAPSVQSSKAEVWYLKQIVFGSGDSRRRVKIITQNFNG